MDRYVQDHYAKQGINRELWKEGFISFGGSQVAFLRETKHTELSHPWCLEGQRKTNLQLLLQGQRAGGPQQRELKIEVLDKEMGFGRVILLWAGGHLCGNGTAIMELHK